MTRLTDHFTLEEMCATKHKDIDNTLPMCYYDNMLEICEILERLRRALGGKPIKINSGYRCRELNRAVGGSEKSLHLTGEAVDIACENLDDACRKMAKLARLCADFDELYIEGSLRTERVWLHFGYKNVGLGLGRCGFIAK
ncbi:MAG: peptidase M15 [Prevotella sp.]|nr:peptidase M15 [Prevotella sp.]